MKLQVAHPMTFIFLILFDLQLQNNFSKSIFFFTYKDQLLLINTIFESVHFLKSKDHLWLWPYFNQNWVCSMKFKSWKLSKICLWASLMSFRQASFSSILSFLTDPTMYNGVAMLRSKQETFVTISSSKQTSEDAILWFYTSEK